MVSNSTYFKESFKSLKKQIPITLEYSGTKHNDLIKNIKDDVTTMSRIESLDNFQFLSGKSLYLSCVARLNKVLNKLLELENK